ncbi:MAG: hypothetical protein II988_04935 [Clostridia bacterium]|nr:hypothetical protein [Clostridia bacterium]
MKKGTSIVLLSIISILMAFMLVMTFARFPIGTNKNYNSVLGAIELDHGMSDSVVYTYKMDPNSEIPEDIEQVIDTVSYRLTALGYDNHTLKAVKSVDADVYDIRVEVNPSIDEYYQPDQDTVTNVIQTAFAYGEVTFFGGSQSGPTSEIFTDVQAIEKAEYTGYDSYSKKYICAITFTSQAFSEITEIMEEGDFYLKVTLGDQTLSPFDGNSAISEGFFLQRSISIQCDSEDTAKQMALQITSGGLAYKYTLKDTNSALISSPYGNNVASVSLIVLGAITLAFAIALIVKDKGLGVISCLSIVLFFLVTASMLIAVPGVKLSLGGVIGLLVSAIMIIDAMFTLNKNVKNQFASGKTVKSAIRAGFKDALLPTLNGGVIAVVIGLLLYFITQAEIKAFALTLIIGVVIAQIIALAVSRLFVAVILPLVKDKEKFLNLKREDA